jgi:hypothetical protein
MSHLKKHRAVANILSSHVQAPAITCSQLISILSLLAAQGQHQRCAAVVALWAKVADRHKLIEVRGSASCYSCCEILQTALVNQEVQGRSHMYCKLVHGWLGMWYELCAELHTTPCYLMHKLSSRLSSAEGLICIVC